MKQAHASCPFTEKDIEAWSLSHLPEATKQASGRVEVCVCACSLHSLGPFTPFSRDSGSCFHRLLVHETQIPWQEPPLLFILVAQPVLAQDAEKGFAKVDRLRERELFSRPGLL